MAKLVSGCNFSSYSNCSSIQPSTEAFTLLAYPSCHWARGERCPGQVTRLISSAFMKHLIYGLIPSLWCCQTAKVCLFVFAGQLLKLDNNSSA